MSSSTTQTTLNREQLILLTNKILNGNTLHFIPYSLLFLPFTFTAFTAVQFYFSTSSGNDLTIKFDLITFLAFGCFVILPTVAGVASITYNTNQIIHHKPITFSSTLKSLSHSYIPFLHTFIAGSLTIIIGFLVLTLCSMAVTKAVKALALDFDPFLFSFFIDTIVSFAFAITIFFLLVIWGSAASITVLESISGFESLQQSRNHSTEFRRQLLSIVYVTGSGVGTALALFVIAQISGPAHWIWILQVVALCLQLSLMILQYVVANTVLYVQCMVASGEEIAKTEVEAELSGEDVRLVVNDNNDEFLHELAMEKANERFNYSGYLLFIVWVIVSLCNLVFVLKNMYSK